MEIGTQMHSNDETVGISVVNKSVTLSHCGLFHCNEYKTLFHLLQATGISTNFWQKNGM